MTILRWSIAVVVGVIAVVVVVVALQPTTAIARDDSTSNKIADNGQYGTYLDTYQVNGRTISCLVANKHDSASISCDWTAK